VQLLDPVREAAHGLASNENVRDLCEKRKRREGGRKGGKEGMSNPR